jgi:TP901 family phage tail tape measure protein
MPEIAELRAKITTESDGKGVDEAENKLSKFGVNAAKAAQVATAGFIAFGAAATAALVASATSAVAFQDKMADVAKTTGITGDGLAQLSDDLLKLSKSTRTSADELASIAEIGGQLGVAEDQIMSFTKQIDVFNVALGKDFSGGVEEAATSMGKLTTLFGETKDLDVADAINRAGSAINTLGAIGAGTTANMTEFATRLGQLPEALRPSIQDALALGTLFEEAGLSAQIASGGMTNFFLVAGKEIDGFAALMGMTTKKAQELLSTDPTEFAIKFSESLKGMDAVELANTLDTLKIGTQETIKVVGALGGGVDRFRLLQSTANAEFAKGTSLINEFNVKNNTAAAQMDKFKNIMNATAITIGNALLPALNMIMDAVLPAVDAFATFAAQHPTVVAAILAIVAGAGLLATVLLGINGLLTAIGVTATISVLPVIGIFLLVAAAVAALFLAWQNNFMNIQGIVNGFLGFMQGTVWPVLQSIFGFIGAVLTTLGQIFTNIFNLIIIPLLTAFVGFLSNTFWKPIENVFKLMTAGLNALGLTWGDVWNGIKSLVFGILNSIVGEIKRRINDVIGGINMLIRGANSVGDKIPGYTTVNEIPMLAEGARNFRGGPAIVGERGPELVNLPRGSDVYSNPELQGMGGKTIQQTNHIYSDVDVAFALRDLSYALRTA